MPKLLIKTYAFDLEILVLAHTFGYKICEAPVEVNYKGKFGRIGLFSIVTILIDTLAIYYRLKILKYYDYPRAKLTVMPKVSVIIAVKEKTRYLEECIKFCKMLDYPDYEIIVLPDQKICLTEKDIKIIPTGEVLPPKKRDIGSSYAAGEVLAFLDDDSYPREDWLKQAVKNFSHRDVVAVGGPAVDTPNDSPQQHASGTIFSSWIVSGNYVFRYVPKVLRESDDLPSCNFLVKKEDYQKVGGFSAKFWPGEDTFLCFKLTRLLKKKILYDPEVIVYHHRRALFLPHLRQISRYALHRGYFAKRFPQTSLKLSYFLPSLFVSYIIGGAISFVYLNTFLRFAFLSSLLLYLALVAFASAKALNLRLIGLTFIGIILTHLTYGIFLIKGLFSLRMPEEGVNSDAAK